jgi:hypothetical protein
MWTLLYLALQCFVLDEVGRVIFLGLRVGFMVQALEGEIQARPHVTFVKNLMTGNVRLLRSFTTYMRTRYTDAHSKQHADTLLLAAISCYSSHARLNIHSS